MTDPPRLRLLDIEQSVCDIAAQQLGIPRHQLAPHQRLLEDLRCDSLDMIELLMEVEDEFRITIPHDSSNPVFKTVFTRKSFTLSDLAEIVYIQQGTGKPERRRWHQSKTEVAPSSCQPFTQLDGCWDGVLTKDRPLFEPITPHAEVAQYRRRTDGMRCFAIPSAEVELGSDQSDTGLDEIPKHVAEIDSFLIDAELVSTTAYCRFLNSIGEVNIETLSEWIVLDANDKRNNHMLITRSDGKWSPLPGCEKWPVILVSWFGANAYSLWANGRDWRLYSAEQNDGSDCFLPSESQWEYAARGRMSQQFPWGDEPPTSETMRFGQHRKGFEYKVGELPLADVNETLGMSPFGLHHVAGNVWQWCRDWYSDCFYQRPESRFPNPVNREPTQIRSERGGSWIGPAELCRSSFRRGRPPNIRGRCLGFRCIGELNDVS